jgi:hypothetical protein
LRSASKPSSGSFAASRFAAFTNACSECWRWRASRWIPGCERIADTEKS